MKKSHIAAIGCFSIALLLYAFSSTRGASVGLALLGGVFELMGWKNVLSSRGSGHELKPLSKN
jgi:hypothetical protein